MYKVLPHKKAVKYYEGIDDKTAARINKAIDRISKNPHEGQNIKKLSGMLEGKYRCKVGDLRIVYKIDENNKTVLIEAIGPRGDVYK